MIEWCVVETGGYEATDVADIGEQVRSDTITDLSEATVFELARIG